MVFLEKREVFKKLTEIEKEVFNLDNLHDDDYEEHDECRNKIMALLDEIREYICVVPLP